MSRYTIEELIDIVQMDITFGCTLPKTLPDNSIRLFIETRAAKWFYRNYQYALSKMYYHVDRSAFSTEEYTKYSYLTLPCEIQSISYIYQMRSESLFQLGMNVPNMSINMGSSSQPYLSSFVSTIGELGVYKTMLTSMSDMLNQMNLYTTKFHYNEMTNQLNVLTDVKYNLVLEAYANIPLEHLYADDLFQKYVIGWSKKQAGNLMGRYTFTLPGGVTYNSGDLVTQGGDEMKEVEEEIKNMSQVAFFYMVKK
jgi:hypothetical protein